MQNLLLGLKKTLKMVEVEVVSSTATHPSGVLEKVWEAFLLFTLKEWSFCLERTIYFFFFFFVFKIPTILKS